METIYLAGGCVWGTQAYIKTLPGVVETEAGRANGETSTLEGPYDGYVESIKTVFDPKIVSPKALTAYLFEAINPYLHNRQGEDVGPKYRTGIYSTTPQHLEEVSEYIQSRADADRIIAEVLPLTQFVPSAPEHQDYLDRHPDDYCHIPKALLERFR
ncbi:peptide-methionine (S)-S-oxide reductase [Staphylococcus canis]|uniref:Peptide methionine sulfoxide reductase MsrA n=1 Tax=Staphylococcus canis TaxID=2724942 RepID=A0ABS0TBC3_9STAP|nr:peptide-methionine (S)-S-oxide reductase [Staphylococcus canis]MBI5975712.1 peptide-methionine (S)-S-oxide reductase [Staphylococcus canis]